MTNAPATGPSGPVRAVTLRANADLPAVARAFVRQAIEELEAPVPEAAVLLTSEVTANAVDHADTEVVVLSVERLAGRVRVSVHDDDSAPPVLQPPGSRRVGGMGVFLVDQLAADWGVVEIADDGKRVWFDLDV